MREIVIIPAYNEVKTIQYVVIEVRKRRPMATVLVIDDGSRDGTAEVALEAGARVFSHARNRGYYEALRTGYTLADYGGYEAVILLDADDQHDPSYIPALIRELECGADLVVGSRFISGDPGYSVPFLRLLGMRFFSWLASWKCGVQVMDTTSGFRAMNLKALRFCMEEHRLDADLLVRAVRVGLKIKEIPVQMRESKSGRSMYGGIRSVFYVVKMLYSLGRT